MGTRTFILILSCIFIMASVFFYIVIYDYAEEESPDKEYKPSVVGKKVRGHVYNGDDGTVEYEYKAKQLEFFKIADVTRFVDPYMFAYDTDRKSKKWEIWSKDGIYNTGDSISLYNDVNIVTFTASEADKGSLENIRILTSYLELDLGTKDIRSNRQVDMVDRVMSENHGKFLEGNIDSNQYRFNEDCHAIIQPDDFKNFNEK
jgi:LPS export ABC transporter protein LptC